MCKYTRDTTLNIVTECGRYLIDDELETIPLFRFCPFCAEEVLCVFEDEHDLSLFGDTVENDEWSYA